MLHQDVKPANVLVATGRYVLSPRDATDALNHELRIEALERKAAMRYKPSKYATDTKRLIEGVTGQPVNPNTNSASPNVDSSTEELSS